MHDPLFVAMTRPATRWGVTLPYLTLYWVLIFIGFIAANSFWPFAAAPFAHALGVLLFRRDPYFLDILARYVGRCASSRARRLLGAAVYHP